MWQCLHEHQSNIPYKYWRQLTYALCIAWFLSLKIVVIATATTIDELLTLSRGWVMKVASDGSPTRTRAGGKLTYIRTFIRCYTAAWIPKLHCSRRTETARDTQQDTGSRNSKVGTRGGAGRSTGCVNLIPWARGCCWSGASGASGPCGGSGGDV